MTDQTATEATDLDKTRRYLRPVAATIISDDPDGVHLAVYSWLPMFDEWATGPGLCGESMRQGALPEGTQATCPRCLEWQPKYERMLAPGYRPEDDDPEILRQRLAEAREETRKVRERLRLTTDEKVADLAGPTNDLLCAEINRLKAEVAAARKFAGEMRDFCSPHGVSVGYADRLLEAMDRAKAADPGPPGTVRGPVPAEYVRLKGQLEADLRKMAACAAQPPRPGAEEVRAMQGGITAGICSSLARAIQCFEGPAARGAFLKRVERTEASR
jgi:hypothetical protein